MSQSPLLRQRVLSAKPNSLHEALSRPVSGMPSQTYSRKELIEHIYTMQSQVLPSRTASAKAIARQTQVGLEKSKRIVVRQSRKKEELEEEILRLKQSVNQLSEQLCQQKGKTESMRKKGSKLTKILSIQYENEALWNTPSSHSHLVAAIKHTYDSLKDKYEALQQEHAQLLMRPNTTNELQYITYIDSLEKENKALTRRLTAISEGTNAKDVANYLISELQVQCQALGEKYSELQGRHSMLGQTLKDRNKKIEFIQKMIIDKDNQLHTLQRQANKYKDELHALRQINEDLQHSIHQQRSMHEGQIFSLQERMRVGEREQGEAMGEALRAKDRRIAELEKENTYLNGMIAQLRRNHTETTQLLLQSTNNNKGNSNTLFLPLPQEQHHTPSPSARKTLSAQKDINYLGQQYRTVSQHSQCTQPLGVFSQGRRVPQKADKKHHQHAQKKRRISLDQISQLVELVRLKLVNSNFPFSRVRALFEADPRKGEWEAEYINMREVQHLLSFPPFSLPKDKAQLLARYLIEDVQTDFVYCDDFNENTREIVKSILKALLRDYPTCTANSHLELEVKKFMQSYQVNLKRALAKIEPSGVISKRKFQETLGSLNMECSEEVECVLLGRMAAEASTIHELAYSALFA